MNSASYNGDDDKGEDDDDDNDGADNDDDEARDDDGIRSSGRPCHVVSGASGRLARDNRVRQTAVQRRLWVQLQKRLLEIEGRGFFRTFLKDTKAKSVLLTP